MVGRRARQASGLSAAAAAEESATSSTPSSPEPILDDDAYSFVLQSNESQSSFGPTSSRETSPSPTERSRPKIPIQSLPPELLIFIFQKLSSTQDLYNALRVSKKWARCCVELLWHRPLFTEWSKLTKVAHAIRDPNSYWVYTDLIKRLNLANLSDSINDGTLETFADCKRIERLTLTGCSNLNDQSIIRLVEGNRSLLALDITNIANVTDETINTLASNSPRLQGLNVTGCSSVTDQSLVPLANACKYLKRLKLNKCSLVTDDSIEAFATRCPSMLEIDLQGCDQITDTSITALLQTDKYLRELRLASCQKVTDQAFLSLSPLVKLDSLRILDLTACHQLTDLAVEKVIEAAPRLRILVLAKCVDITDRAVYAISKLGKNLHDIHLGRCVNITDAALKELVTKCNRIRYIDLAGCTRVTDDSIKMLANLPKLRRIGLVKCQNITDASIRALARGTTAHGHNCSRSQLSSSLERVHLSYCVNITLEGINELLHKCPKLTHLSLTGIQAFFTRDDLVKFCRDAPPEFNEEQRTVFCVFSGDGVNQLRNHLANDPTALPSDDVSMYDDGPDSSDEVDERGHSQPSTHNYIYAHHYHHQTPPHQPQMGLATFVQHNAGNVGEDGFPNNYSRNAQDFGGPTGAIAAQPGPAGTASIAEGVRTSYNPIAQIYGSTLPSAANVSAFTVAQRAPSTSFDTERNSPPIALPTVADVHALAAQHAPTQGPYSSSPVNPGHHPSWQHFVHASRRESSQAHRQALAAANMMQAHAFMSGRASREIAAEQARLNADSLNSTEDVGHNDRDETR